jgi:hypothetical protein
MDKNELLALVAAEQLTLTDVLDAVVEVNGLRGVGLISLSEDIRKYLAALKDDYTAKYNYLSANPDRTLGWNDVVGAGIHKG